MRTIGCLNTNPAFGQRYFGAFAIIAMLVFGMVGCVSAIPTPEPVNTAPVLTEIASQTVNEKETIAFTVTASDADAADSLTYSLVGAPDGANIDPVTGVFSWTAPDVPASMPFTFIVTVSDGSLTTEQSVTITVINVNAAPVLADIASQAINEKETVAFTATASDPDAADILTYSLVDAPGSAFIDPATGVFSWTTPEVQTSTPYIFMVTVSDGFLADEQSVTITVNNVNHPPTLNPVGDKTVNVGEPLTFTVSGSDPDGDTLAYSAPVLQAGTTLDPTTGGFTWTPGSSQAGEYPVTFTVTDSGSLSASESITITVTDVPRDTQAPLILNFIATPNPAPINEPVTITATIDDSTTGGSAIKSAHYSIDGSDWVAMNAVDGAWDTMIEKVAITLPAYTSAGIHTIRIQAADAADNTAESSEIILLAVYDPSSGFVTGGGWINSPAGAYTADPAMTGKANFGFVAKYKKGATVPTGETEFQFKAGNLNFHSGTYDWLVIAGPKAQFKGIGTINGQGSYGFMLTAVDGAMNGGGGQDMFRIKISDKSTGNLVYDNLLDAPDTADPTTVLGGGSIIIHK